MMATAHQHHFLPVYPGSFGNEHALRMAGPGSRLPQEHGDVQTLREQLELQAREIQRLQGTTSHYRAWAAQLQARYQMFSPDAARPAKRVYVGNLPPEMNEELVDTELRNAINELMAQIGGVMGDGPAVASCKLYPGGNNSATNTAPQRAYCRRFSSGSARSRSPSLDGSGGGDAPSSPSGVVRLSNTSTETSRTTKPRSNSTNNLSSSSTTAPSAAAGSYNSSLPRGHPSQSGFPYIASPSPPQDKSYAFVEFRSVEEASNCMALDGVRFKDTFLKIRRPNNYDPAVAIMLGPIEPSPALDLSGLDIVRTVVQDSPHKVFIGGLPCDWTEEQVTEMLVPFGTLKAFNLVMDRATGNSRGYAFCEFIDVAITDNVITALHGKPVGNKYLTVKRALGPTPY